MKITAQVIIEITDEDALRRDVQKAIETWDIDDEEETGAYEPADQGRVMDDLIEGLVWLVEPSGLVDSSGVEVVQAEHGVVELDDSGEPVVPPPDFAELFAWRGRGEGGDEEYASGRITPRTAAALWTSAQILADQAYDDVEMHGDEPVGQAGYWALFEQYPRITWSMDAVWRRQAARSFDDLTADLEAGRRPAPTCPAEEMALHLTMDHAKEASAGGSWPVEFEETLSLLPVHRCDFRWESLSDSLFQDEDILELFNIERDGIEDPDTEENRQIGMGDYTPSAWFVGFSNMEPRDPRRPFRR